MKQSENLIRAREFMQRLGIRKTKFYEAKKAGPIPLPVDPNIFEEPEI